MRRVAPDITIEVMRWPDSLTLSAQRDGREIGRINVNARAEGARVTTVTVEPTYRRLGIATQLYRAAAREACSHLGQPLVSGIVRSAQAEGFWRKQLAKGRANEHTDTETGKLFYALRCPAPRSLGAR